MIPDNRPKNKEQLNKTMRTMRFLETSVCLWGVRQRLTDSTGLDRIVGHALFIRKVGNDKFQFVTDLFSPEGIKRHIKEVCKNLGYARWQHIFGCWPYVLNSEQVVNILSTIQQYDVPTDESIYTFLSMSKEVCDEMARRQREKNGLRTTTNTENGLEIRHIFP